MGGLKLFLLSQFYICCIPPCLNNNKNTIALYFEYQAQTCFQKASDILCNIYVNFYTL